VLVAAPAAVARTDVHQLVGPEQQQPAVVVGLGVAHEQHLAGGARVGHILAPAVVLDHALVAVLVGVVDVEQPALRVVGRERHRQQPLLAARRDQLADVQERLAQRLAAADHLDLPGLLDNEEPARVAGRRGDVDRRVERPDFLQADPGGLRLGRAVGRAAAAGER
jgi:hypothetical protein